MPLLTATASVSVRKKILKVAYMRNVEIINLSPEKQNIEYMVEKVGKEVEEVINKVLTELKEKRKSTTKTEVYYRSNKIVVNRSVFLTSI